jgi:hypothetical protein
MSRMEHDDKLAIAMKGLEEIAKGELTRSKQVELAQATLARIGHGTPSHVRGLTPIEIANRQIAAARHQPQVRR